MTAAALRVLSLTCQICRGLEKVGDSGRLTLPRNMSATAETVAEVPNDEVPHAIRSCFFRNTESPSHSRDEVAVACHMATQGVNPLGDTVEGNVVYDKQKRLQQNLVDCTLPNHLRRVRVVVEAHEPGPFSSPGRRIRSAKNRSFERGSAIAG